MPDHAHLDIPGRRPIGGALAAVAGIVVVLAVAAALLAFLLRSDTITAPDLRGLTVAQARGAAAEAGLDLAPPEEALPDDVVVGQRPDPGAEVPEGATVSVIVARPPAAVTVPDLLGRSIAEARALLEAAGLKLGALREDPDAAGPPGVVARQLPAADGSATEGESVSVWIAAAATVSVPDLTGLEREEVVEAAARAGLAARFLSEVTDEVLPGLSFRQSPRAGARVTPGSEVVVVVNAAAPGPGVEDGGTPATGAPAPPPAAFSALARTYPFTVVYPTYLPPGMTLAAADNPGHRTGPEGSRGFEVTYVSLDGSGARLALLEGEWFDPGLEGATLVDVRGLTAALAEGEGTVVLVWEENGTRYALSGAGLPRSEVLAVAAGLRPVPTA